MEGLECSSFLVREGEGECDARGECDTRGEGDLDSGLRGLGLVLSGLSGLRVSRSSECLVCRDTPRRSSWWCRASRLRLSQVRCTTWTGLLVRSRASCCW